MDDESKKKLVDQTHQILQLGMQERSGRKGSSVLVVGEVQSGKTLSFTSAACMARDSGFDYVVVVAGTKKNLRDQTFERLVEDLPGLQENWNLLKSPTAKHEGGVIEGFLRAQDPAYNPKTPVFVVMKTAAGMHKMRHVIEAIQLRFGNKLRGLLIDDEADQAGLNIADDKVAEQSTVFSSLRMLRESMRDHTFLLYTATSQALTVVGLADHMSPDYVKVLEAAPSYVGADDLFSEESAFTVEISREELSFATNAVESDPPVASFSDALIYFYLLLAVKSQLGLPRQVSMLVHPDVKKLVHGAYVSWISKLNEKYLDILSECIESGEITPAALNLLEEPWDELISRGAMIPSLDSGSHALKVVGDLTRAIKNIQVREVNTSGRGRDVAKSDWSKHEGWILVGGAKLERGYTVENLIVTYMPRGRGIGISDTIQQRGRFFGHKRHYAPWMRGWFSEDVILALREIAEFEALFKESLLDVVAGGTSLKEWEREFVISANLALTRKAAIGLGLTQTVFKGGFVFSQRHLFGPLVNSVKSYEAAIGLLKPYLADAKLFDLDRRTQGRRHLYSQVDLSEVVALLERWPMAQQDRRLLKRLTRGILDYTNKFRGRKAVFLFMDGLENRIRSAAAVGEVNSLDGLSIENLFQGRSQSKANSYLGDREMRSIDSITVQFHTVTPRFEGIESNKVLAIAISWPSEFQRVYLTS
jgi:hypothetical protein